MHSAMLKLSGSLMPHPLRLKAINTIICQGRTAGAVLIHLRANIGSISHSPTWGIFAILTRMGDSVVSDCGDDVFVEARASQHHAQCLIMTIVNTAYKNTDYKKAELLDQELNFDELQEVNGGILILAIPFIIGEIEKASNA